MISAEKPVASCSQASSSISIDGLDAEALLARVGGDAALAWSVLQRFAESQCDAAAHLPELVEHDPATARSRTHELKGMLGNIGAMDLYEHAVRLNTLLRDGRPGDALGLARALHEGIPRLCRCIDLAAPRGDTDTAARTDRPRTAADAAVTAEHFSALARSLGTGRVMDARRSLDALAAVTLDAAEQALIERLTPLVNAYRLREAAALLASARYG